VAGQYGQASAQAIGRMMDLMREAP
jgi:hypothetical protein